MFRIHLSDLVDEGIIAGTFLSHGGCGGGVEGFFSPYLTNLTSVVDFETILSS